MQAERTEAPGTELAVLEPGEPTLAELAETANREHEMGVAAVGAGLAHFIASGAALLDARDRILADAPSGWTPWLEKNFHASTATARTWMRFAAYREVIEREGITSYTVAERYLRGLPVAGEESLPNRRYGDAIREEAHRLHGAGANASEIARLLGVDRTTVETWIIPGERERRAQRALRRYRRKAAERRAEQQAQRDSAVRKVGGSVAESYSMIRKTLQALDRAHVDATDREVRAALSAAMAKMHNAEDEIVRALGIS